MDAVYGERSQKPCQHGPSPKGQIRPARADEPARLARRQSPRPRHAFGQRGRRRRPASVLRRFLQLAQDHSQQCAIRQFHPLSPAAYASSAEFQPRVFNHQSSRHFLHCWAQRPPGDYALLIKKSPFLLPLFLYWYELFFRARIFAAIIVSIDKDVYDTTVQHRAAFDTSGGGGEIHGNLGVIFLSVENTTFLSLFLLSFHFPTIHAKNPSILCDRVNRPFTQGSATQVTFIACSVHFCTCPSDHGGVVSA